jgi:hypothetical protein
MKINIRGASENRPPETAKIVNDSGCGFVIHVEKNTIQIRAKSAEEKSSLETEITGECHVDRAHCKDYGCPY